MDHNKKDEIVQFFKDLCAKESGAQIEINETKLKDYISYLQNKRLIIEKEAPKEEILNKDIVDIPPNETLNICFKRTEAKDITYNNGILKAKKKRFKFHNYFDNISELLDKMNDFIIKRIDYNDSCILFYGISGCGKSYTCENLLMKLVNITEYEIKKIYNNVLSIVENKQKFTDMTELISKIKSAAVKSNNGINANSSRAHLIISLYFGEKKVHLIDMCGSEKSSFFTSQIETININKDIFAINQFMNNKNYVDNKNELLKIIKGIANIIFVYILYEQKSMKIVDQLNTLQFLKCK